MRSPLLALLWLTLRGWPCAAATSAAARPAKAQASQGVSAAADVSTELERLESGNWNERLHAVYVLGAIGPSARAPMRLALADLDWQIRLTAVHWLGRMGKPAIPELVGVLRDEPCRLIRITAANWLGSMGPAAVPALEGSIRGEESALVRLSDRYWLRRYEPVGESSSDAPRELERAEEEDVLTCRSSDAPGLLPDYALRRAGSDAASTPDGPESPESGGGAGTPKDQTSGDDPPAPGAAGPRPAAGQFTAAAVPGAIAAPGAAALPGEVVTWVRRFSTSIEARQEALDRLAPDYLQARRDSPRASARSGLVGHAWADSSRLPDAEPKPAPEELAEIPLAPSVGSTPGTPAAPETIAEAAPRLAVAPKLFALPESPGAPPKSPSRRDGPSPGEPPPAVAPRPAADPEMPGRSLEGAPESFPPAPTTPARGLRPAAAPELARDAGTLRLQDPLPALVSALASKDSHLRFRAADELGKLGVRSRSAEAPLVRALRRDPEGRVRASAALALGNIGAADSTALEALAKALRDPDLDVEFSAARALGRIDSPDARRVFERYQRDAARTLLYRER